MNDFEKLLKCFDEIGIQYMIETYQDSVIGTRTVLTAINNNHDCENRSFDFAFNSNGKYLEYE